MHSIPILQPPHLRLPLPPQGHIHAHLHRTSQLLDDYLDEPAPPPAPQSQSQGFGFPGGSGSDPDIQEDPGELASWRPMLDSGIMVLAKKNGRGGFGHGYGPEELVYGCKEPSYGRGYPEDDGINAANNIIYEAQLG